MAASDRAETHSGVLSGLPAFLSSRRLYEGAQGQRVSYLVVFHVLKRSLFSLPGSVLLVVPTVLPTVLTSIWSLLKRAKQTGNSEGSRVTPGDSDQRLIANSVLPRGAITWKAQVLFWDWAVALGKERLLRLGESTRLLLSRTQSRNPKQSQGMYDRGKVSWINNLGRIRTQILHFK